MHFIRPVGTFGFRRPQHTSRESSPDRTETSSLVRTNGLSLISVIAAPPPLSCLHEQCFLYFPRFQTDQVAFHFPIPHQPGG